MKLWHKGIAALSCTAMITGLLAGSALAAEEREKITKIYLTIDSSIEIGDDSGDVSVTTDGDTYKVDEVEITNDDGEWKAGDEPRVKITLEADDDYYFSSTSSSTFKLSGDDATYVSASRKNSNSTLILTIKLDKLEGDLAVDSVQWEDDNTPIATWEDAEGSGAKSYQVRLYRGSSSMSEAITTSNTTYDFSSYFTKTGDYLFKVRAVGNNSKKGDWVESDSFYVDEDELAKIRSGAYSNGSGSSSPGSTPNQSGAWHKDNVGWWYVNSNGTYTTNGWQMINNQWYCFDSVGYMRTGWIQSVNVWYYCDTNTGAMLTNTTTPDGYRVDANGIWVQ